MSDLIERAEMLEEEQKEGEWNYTDDMFQTLYCSVCGFDTENYIYYNYCPNCKARMKNGKESR